MTAAPPDRLLVLAPLAVEAAAARRGAPGARVVRTGLGAGRSRRAARRWQAARPVALAVVGVAGALEAALAPGDVVVASELRAPGEPTRPCPHAAAAAAAVRARGLKVHVGPLICIPRLVRGSARRRLAAGGALAVDLESYWLAAAAPPGTPVAVVRAIVDTPERELHRLAATARGGVRALRSLRRTAAGLEAWAAELGAPVARVPAPLAEVAQ